MYGAWVFPVDAEYEFRLRIANFRGGDVVVNSGNGPGRGAGRGAAGPPGAADASCRTARRARARPRTGGVAPYSRRLPNSSEPVKKLPAWRRRRASSSSRWTVSPIITEVVEGTTTFGYDRGEFTARASGQSRGAHFLRASFPELADLDDPRQEHQSRQRRALFVDYLDIVGPFNPSTGAAGELPRSLFAVMRQASTPPSARARGQSNPDAARLSPSRDTKRGGRQVQAGRAGAEGRRLARRRRAAGARKRSWSRPISCSASSAIPRPRPAHIAPSATTSSRRACLTSSGPACPTKNCSGLPGTDQLRKPAVLEAQVRRMMADPKASNLVDNFAAQWLQLRNLGRTKPDPRAFPRSTTSCSTHAQGNQPVRRSDHQGRPQHAGFHRRAVHVRQRPFWRVTTESRASTAKSSSA